MSAWQHKLLRPHPVLRQAALLYEAEALMAVDPYGLCPCGTGKKLKFCCADLVGDIEKIHRMIEGDQPRAALQHVEKTLQKHPGRASLLDLKATLELTLEQFDDAATTVEELIKADPKSPSAYAQRAILVSSQENGRAAVRPLQQAIALVEQTMPRRVLEAIGAVGHALLLEGNIIAARAHLWLYQGISGQEDTRALQLLVRMNQMAGLPLLLRDHLYMQPAPEGHPCTPDHDRAQIFASRGMWLPAAQVFDSLCGLNPDVPTLIYNRALVYGWLGDIEKFVAGMHDYATRDVDPEDAVEAEALAQLLDPDQKEAAIDVVKLVYPVTDEEELLARFTSDKRIASYDIDPAELASQEGPPPRGAYLLLDKPLPDSSEGIARDQIPSVIGFLSHYGRQTDREERLELVLDKNDEFAGVCEQFEQLTQGFLGDAEPESRVGESNATEQVLSWRWHFPPDTPPRDRRALLTQQRREAILEKWPQTPRAALGGKSPSEASSDESLRIPLQAAILLLEQGANNQSFGEAFAELRGQLGLPALEPLEVSDVELGELPLGRLPRLNLSEVGDEELVALYQRAVLAGATPAIQHICREAVRRPSVADKIDPNETYHRLVSGEEDAEKALAILAEARTRAEREGKSSAPWDLLELELHVVEGSPEEANRVLQHVRNEHIDEPGVAEQLYQILYALGAMPEGLGDGPVPPSVESAGVPEPAAATGGKIWTPDSDGEGGGKKLWTPS